MKSLKIIAGFAALALGAVPSVATASESSMRVNVPFAFVVAGQPFAPGEYVISQNDAGVVLVQGAGRGAMVISSPASPAISSHGSSLEFTNAQEHLNLTSVAQEGAQSRSIPVRAVEQRTVTMSSR